MVHHSNKDNTRPNEKANKKTQISNGPYHSKKENTTQRYFEIWNGEVSGDSTYAKVRARETWAAAAGRHHKRQKRCGLLLCSWYGYCCVLAGAMQHGKAKAYRCVRHISVLLHGQRHRLAAALPSLLHREDDACDGSWLLTTSAPPSRPPLLLYACPEWKASETRRRRGRSGRGPGGAEQQGFSTTAWPILRQSFLRDPCKATTFFIHLVLLRNGDGGCARVALSTRWEMRWMAADKVWPARRLWLCIFGQAYNWALGISKIFKIVRHIESLCVCIEY